MTTNAELLNRRMSAVAHGISNSTPLTASHAQNAEIFDVEGNRYIDFAAGIAVLNTGHLHPKVMAAASRQMESMTHSCFQVVMYEPYIALAERLNSLCPIDGPAKTALFSTGAEATENAIKIARAATGRSAVIAFGGAFHGRTFMAMALTGKMLPYKEDFGPMMPEVYHLPFPAEQSSDTTADTIHQLEVLFKSTIAPSRVAALIIEPVQGEGGFYQAPDDLMRALREICTRHGIVMIADEIQTGFARTGKMFAMEHYDVRPDLMCLAKSLGGGFPISAVVGKASIMDAPKPGGLGSTYAGNPVACAAALAVLDVIADENLSARANSIGAMMRNRLAKLQGRNGLQSISGIRGLGAMIAFDIVTEPGGRQPAPDQAKSVVRKAYQAGLIILTCGTSSIRLLCPLTASDDLVREGLDRLEIALAL